MKKIATEVQEHPILSIFMASATTALVAYGTATFATMSYVNNKEANMKKYVGETYSFIQRDVMNRDSEVKEQLRDIKKSVQIIERHVIDLYKQGK